jgi:hypothetical protein
VTTKSRRLELGVTTNFSQVQGVKANVVRQAVGDSLRRLQTDGTEHAMFAGKRSCSSCTTCSARDARSRAVIESLHAVQLRLSDDGGALTAMSDSDT